MYSGKVMECTSALRACVYSGKCVACMCVFGHGHGMHCMSAKVIECASALRARGLIDEASHDMHT